MVEMNDPRARIVLQLSPEFRASLSPEETEIILQKLKSVATQVMAEYLLRDQPPEVDCQI